MDNPPKDLQDIYDKITTRFPMGRLPAYMIANSFPEITVVIQELKGFVAGKDSDRRYTDEQSKQDAQSLMDELIKYREQKEKII